MDLRDVVLLRTLARTPPGPGSAAVLTPACCASSASLEGESTSGEVVMLCVSSSDELELGRLSLWVPFSKSVEVESVASFGMLGGRSGPVWTWKFGVANKICRPNCDPKEGW